MKLGTLRTRFAWWPVRLWDTGDKYAFVTGKIRWLCRVTESYTMQGWTAYIRYNARQA